MTRRILFLCGMLSPLVYVFMTILGGTLRPDYSHSYHAVSELMEAGAPNKWLLDILLSLSDILGILFGCGVLFLVFSRKVKRGIGLAGSSCLIAIGILELIVALFFPMDPRHATPTFAGLMHLFLVGVLSILSVLTPFIFAAWLKHQTDFTGYGVYSLISALLILLTGAFAAVTVFYESTLIGLAERVTVGVYLQWTFFLALKMYTISKQRFIAK